MAAAVASVTSTVGYCRRHRARCQVAHGNEDHGDEDEQRIDIEPRQARTHDHQHAGEADEDRGPAPPPDRLAQEQRGACGHRQRNRLEDDDDVADRHLEQRGEVEERAAQFAENPPRHHLVAQLRQAPVHAHRGRDDRDRHHRRDAADEDDLAHRQAVADQLHQRIVEKECELGGDDGRYAEKRAAGRSHAAVSCGC